MLGSLILYFKGMRRMMIQLSSFYCSSRAIVGGSVWVTAHTHTDKNPKVNVLSREVEDKPTRTNTSTSEQQPCITRDTPKLSGS